MSSEELPFRELSAGPERLCGSSALVRLVDGMGFRYRWATEGLDDEYLSFQASEEAMTLAEVLAHMLVLAEWVDRTLERGLAEGEVERSRPEPPPPTVDGLRRRTLEALLSVRARLEGADDERLVTVEITASRSRGPQPFWSLINGPLADFLTHVGQVAAWRRQAGSPAPRADVFRGEPPGSPDGDS